MELLGLPVKMEGTPMVSYDYEKLPCDHCDACRRICPGKAIGERGFDRTRCIRFHMMSGKKMPEEFRDYIGAENGTKGIIGCDLCQKVCPANHESSRLYSEEDRLTLEELLRCEKDTMSRFAELYGINYALRNRIISQAVLTAAVISASSSVSQGQA